MSPPSAAFDALAAAYDGDFTHNPIARHLRAQVHARLALRYPPSSRVLELGCGTGQDAQYLAERGVYITATDASPQMLAQSRAKHSQLPAETQAYLQHAPLDLHALPTSPPATALDGVFANFGVLNVLADYRPLADWLAQHIRQGGVVGFAVMAPACVWEFIWHAAHLDLRTATRRQRAPAIFRATPTSPAIKIYYPSAKQISVQFAPHFRRVYLRPLGFMLPPSDIYGVLLKRPRVLRWLMQADAATQHAALADFADHYWIELERV